MKHAILFIIIFFASHVWADEKVSTGPVYNFNFSNGASSSNTITSPGAAPTTNPNTSIEVKKEQPSVSKSPFMRSLLDPNENYYGIIGTYLPGINKKHSDFQTKGTFAVNLISTSALWGIKVAKGSSKYSHESEDPYEFREYEANYYQAGINKFIPFMSNLALELGAFFETGRIYQDSGSVDEAYTSNNFKYKAGLASFGLNVFAGNFIVGIQYQARLAFTPENKNYNNQNNIDLLAKEKGLRLNVGLYF